ncbi:hypothetical protein B484DRAFT_414448 [Ochromonadaceae sp. CCMP2298]|nr:hypothetical protein B484DRAFT_414448 [Ochromonadaceae sp. CCMP2298]
MDVKEEIIVLFHAALVGRTDVVQNAITSIRSSGQGEKYVAGAISTGREDGATPLHIAANFGHSDVIRALLIYYPICGRGQP